MWCLVTFLRKKKPEDPQRAPFFFQSNRKPTDKEFLCNIYLGQKEILKDLSQIVSLCA